MYPDSMDAISQILDRLKLTAEVYHHARYCGDWAVDTSGSRRAPFHLMQKGICWLHVAEQKPVKLHPGDLVVLPQDRPHTISSHEVLPDPRFVNQAEQVSASEAEHMMLCGFFDFASQASWPLLDALPQVVVLSHETPSLLPIVAAIFAELEREGVGQTVALEKLSQILFILVVREAIDQGWTKGVLQGLADKHLGPALARIHDDTQSALSLEQLAAMGKMGKTAFTTRFKKMIGQSPMRYVQQWRLQVALDLLHATSLSVAQIAEEVGYESEVSFRQAFRKELGKTPSEARMLRVTDRLQQPI